MHNRLIRTLILIFWLVSMSWLASTRIAPKYFAPKQPDRRVIRPGEKNFPKKDSWRISWKSKTIGNASNEVDIDELGNGTIHSNVEFDQLPIREIGNELFGSFGMLMKLVPLDRLDKQTELSVKSVSHFDPFGSLDRIISKVKLQEFGEVIRLEGRVADQQLHVRVFPGGSFASATGSNTKSLFKKSFDLPADANVTNWLTPEAQFRNLSVGQKWESQVYRAFPPNSPYREIESEVIGKDILPWNGEAVPVFVIEMRDVTGALTASRSDTSRMWVDNRGEVLKQELTLGKARLIFDRVAQNEQDNSGSETE